MLNLLLRKYVSAFALGHHQVLKCIRRRTIHVETWLWSSRKAETCCLSNKFIIPPPY